MRILKLSLIVLSLAFSLGFLFLSQFKPSAQAQSSDPSYAVSASRSTEIMTSIQAAQMLTFSQVITATNTPTTTPSSTNTPTHTATNTPTVTLTSIFTPTVTFTPIFTPTVTLTPSETPTPTPTPSPTDLSIPTVDDFIINGGALNSTSLTVTLSISASDLTNEVVQMSFSNDEITWSTWQAYSTSASWSLSTGDGLKIIYARVRDINDNISSTASDTIFLDTTVDTDFAFTINDGLLYTNQTAVTLTISAKPGTAQMQVSNDGGFAGAIWESYASQKAWTITQYGSYVIPRVVYVRYQDIDGNTSSTYQDDIVLDMTPPEGGFQVIPGMLDALERSVSISGVPPTTGTKKQTHVIYLPLVIGSCSACTQVLLSLWATDDVSGVSQMMISNSPDFVGALWKPYMTQNTWWISTTGPTTIYVKFRDYAGNVSVVYLSTFTP